MANPPDSGEREVRCTCGSTNDVHRIECATLAWLRAPPTPYAGPPPMPAGWLAVRSDFAQRILAALENPESPGEVADVVAELRAAVERKT
jgi:hypothetical protein